MADSRYSKLNAESDSDAVDDPRFAAYATHTDNYNESDLEQSEPYIREIMNAPSEYFLLFFLLMSCGYMLPWTSLGSLITYYKATYSAGFYVKLYCAYYLPGLPIALLQYRYDVYLDSKYGSQNTYLLRGLISFVIMMCILVSLVWIKSKSALIGLFVLLGVCGWLCHGTASMLASMYPPSAIAYLQTGFRCPEIYTIIAVSLLHLGKNATIPNLNIFYVMTSAIVFLGACSWAFVVLDDKSKDYFDIKDNRIYSSDISSENVPLLRDRNGYKNVQNDLIKQKLITMDKNIGGTVKGIIDIDYDISTDVDCSHENGNENENDDISSEIITKINGNSHEKNSDTNEYDNDDINQITKISRINDNINSYANGNSNAINISDRNINTDTDNDNDNLHDGKDGNGNNTGPKVIAIEVYSSSESHTQNNPENKKFIIEKIEKKLPEQKNRFSRFSSYANPIARTRYLLQSVEKAALQLQIHNPNDNYKMNDEILQKMLPLCLALFVVMFCSIFQASFFAYVTSSSGREIEQILYFVRLFADLVGRPLTRLPRPFFLKVFIIPLFVFRFIFPHSILCCSLVSFFSVL